MNKIWLVSFLRLIDILEINLGQSVVSLDGTDLILESFNSCCKGKTTCGDNTGPNIVAFCLGNYDDYRQIQTLVSSMLMMRHHQNEGGEL